jgi:hypothetical protein
MMTLKIPTVKQTKKMYVKRSKEQRTTLNTTLQSMFHVSPLINSLVTKAESALLERELCPVAGETDVYFLASFW